MNASKGNNKKNRAASRVTGKFKNGRRQLLPALMVVGGACGIMAVPASAFELGELKINSTLGQPLRASVAYALSPHEELYDYCVYLRPGRAANGLPSVSQAKVSVADGVILLKGNRVIREPLLTMQVSVDCPYSAHISREYTLMINPAQRIAEAPVAVESSAVQGTVTVTSLVVVETSKPRPPVEPRRILDRPPISESSRYRVQRGDTLSDITSRISNRSIALWPAVDRLFTANPNAFINNDPNQLMAGSWLKIPDLSVAAPAPVLFDAAAPAATETARGPGDSVANAGHEATAALEPAETEETLIIAEEAPAAAAAVVAATEEPSLSAPDTDVSDFANLQPGDVVVGSDGPFVTPIGPSADADTAESMVIPDTEIVGPGLVQPIALVKTAPDRETGGDTGGSWSWLMWLGGAGLALILGLLFFGQTIRQRFGSVAIAAPPEPTPGRRKTDYELRKTQALASIDFQVLESLPHSSSITLDADFDDGTGLQDGSDIDVAQDFGFSASATFEDELDLALPESAAEEDESPATDIIPTLVREDEESILDSEIRPSDDDDQYALSMILDATKQTLGESDEPAKDLQAVPVDLEDTTKSEDFTLRQEVDYEVLEQDYEDELTATQVLNLEVAKAAAELAARMDNDATGEMRTELPKNTPARNDNINDLDNTGTNAEFTAELPAADDDNTVKMPANDDDATVKMPANDDDATVKMPAKDDDMLVDMEFESGSVDTKKKKKAS